MLLDIITILKIMVESVIDLIPYGVLAIFPTVLCTKLVTESWNR